MKFINKLKCMWFGHQLRIDILHNIFKYKCERCKGRKFDITINDKVY